MVRGEYNNISYILFTKCLNIYKKKWSLINNNSLGIILRDLS